MFRGGEGCVVGFDDFCWRGLLGCKRVLCMSMKPLRFPVEDAGESWRGERVEWEETQSGV